MELLDLHNYKIFESPPTLRALLRDIWLGNIKYTDTRVENAWRGKHDFDWNDKRPRLYVREFDLISIARRKDIVSAKKLVGINRARAAVDQLISQSGIRVVRLIQDKPNECAWAQCADNDSVRVKVRTEIAKGFMVERPHIFECPYVVPERQFCLADEKSWACVTQWQSDMTTLAEVYMSQTIQQNLKFMLAALRGNEFMHAAGWTHGDIKPNNVGIMNFSTPTADGVLFDTETALPVGHSVFGLSTWDYTEKGIYPVERCLYGKDIFSWGITLLKVLTKVHPEDRVRAIIQDRDRDWNPNSPAASLRSKVDQLLNDAGASKFKRVIHPMLRKDPEKRPALKVVIEALEKHL